LPILVEGNGDGLSIGRSYRDAPEIDGLVIVPGELPVGEIVPVRIDGAMAYDLTATVEIEPGLVIMPTEMSTIKSEPLAKNGEKVINLTRNPRS
jgi:ABC-type Fe3+-hydroxamate transport system substrate-binding protein